MNDARAAEEAEAFRWEDAARAWVASALAPRRADGDRRLSVATVARVAVADGTVVDVHAVDQTRAVRMGADPPPEPPLEPPPEARLVEGRTAEEKPDGGGGASAAAAAAAAAGAATEEDASAGGAAAEPWFHRGFDPDLAAATVHRVFRSIREACAVPGRYVLAHRAGEAFAELYRDATPTPKVRGGDGSRARAGAPAAARAPADGSAGELRSFGKRVSPGSRGPRRRRAAAAAARRERARGRRVRGRERRRRRRRRRLRRRRRRDSFFFGTERGASGASRVGSPREKNGRSPRGPPPRAPRPRSRRDLRSARVVRRMRRGNVRSELARHERRRNLFSRRGPPPRRGGASRGRAAPPTGADPVHVRAARRAAAAGRAARQEDVDLAAGSGARHQRRLPFAARGVAGERRRRRRRSATRSRRAVLSQVRALRDVPRGAVPLPARVSGGGARRRGVPWGRNRGAGAPRGVREPRRGRRVADDSPAKLGGRVRRNKLLVRR